MVYINISPLQSFMSRTDSHIIIVNFSSDSDSSMYGLFKKLYVKKWKDLVHWSNTSMKHEQENTIQKIKTR
jgi:hypothetical protein